MKNAYKVIVLWLSLLAYMLIPISAAAQTDNKKKVTPFFSEYLDPWLIWGHPGAQEGPAPACILQIGNDTSKRFQIIITLNTPTITVINLRDGGFKGITEDSSGILLGTEFLPGKTETSNFVEPFNFYKVSHREINIIVGSPIEFLRDIVYVKEMNFILNLDSEFSIEIPNNINKAKEIMADCIMEYELKKKSL